MLRKLTLFSCLSFLLLTGCGVLDSGVASQREEVLNYNATVDKTIGHYEQAKKNADEKKETFLNEIVTNSSAPLYVDLEELTEEQLLSFSNYVVVEDTYFTAYGSTGVREVVRLNGVDHRMNISAVWSDSNLVSVERWVISK